ncbi:PIN domain-containing protein [Leptolyngbya sp. NIES-2104]|uniref:PIN domain-containing protein n=1 Tax=Leptolyngbya sp. NIES-2104 TaxID=1552121 RepID=UPI0006EC95D8|nr:PIN domain-containing protein [Leptolyngbya sp. NIES-2104]GAP98334.1 death on curing protein, Doc toxin [Leptolyngbya sp. NIES-2104]
MYLVDTDILIDIQRGHQPAIDWFKQLQELPSIPGYVVMELIQDAQNMQRVRSVLKLVAPLSIVWATEMDCARVLSDFTTYHLSNGLGLLDALIAACAVGRDAKLCTFNLKHYQVIPGLVTEQPYSR